MSGSADWSIKVWNMSSYQLEKSIPAHNKSVAKVLVT